jgi:hypothetical protein
MIYNLQNQYGRPPTIYHLPPSANAGSLRNHREGWRQHLPVPIPSGETTQVQNRVRLAWRRVAGPGQPLQPKVAVRNAQHFVREHVDLVIEFQTDETVAPIISNTYREAKIPFIAVDIPHPGATYYGANNFSSRFNRRTVSGPCVVPSSRLSGMVEGIRSVLRNLEEVPVTYIDGNGLLTGSWVAMRRHLRKTKPQRAVGRSHQRPKRRGRRGRPARIRGGGHRRNLRRCWPERLSRPRRTPPPAHALHRHRRVNPPRAGYLDLQNGSAGCIHPAPIDDGEECRHALSQRPVTVSCPELPVTRAN